MRVWSSKASSAAARAASSTNDVRFFPRALAARSIRLRSSGLIRRLSVSRLGWSVVGADMVQAPMFHLVYHCVTTSSLHLGVSRKRLYQQMKHLQAVRSPTMKSGGYFDKCSAV